MELSKAYAIATRIVAELKPHCTKIIIAGSIRRMKQQVGDIEIVCIPKQTVYEVAVPDLFGGLETTHKETKRDTAFCDAVNKYQKIIGEPTGKNARRQLPEGIVLDLYMTQPENWGYILAIRTGSKEFCQNTLIPYWTKAGYSGHDGFLWRGDKMVPVLTELELFKLCEISYIDPILRK
jgi:DNA polymerase/3'-5' exonuclease PolX